MAHIRFRAAWKRQGHTLDEIPFKAAGGVVGSWFGLVLIVLVLAAQVNPPHIIVRIALTHNNTVLYRTLSSG